MSVEGHFRVTIGRQGRDRLSVRIIGRMHNDATDYWDGNWLVTPIELSVGGFSAEVAATLRAEELRSFRAGIQRIYESLTGEAKLTSMEEWIDLKVTAIRGGKMLISGVLKDHLGSKNRLMFEIGDIDQSDLPGIIDSLDQVDAHYPVIGTPN